MKPLMKRSALCMAIAAGISGYAQGQDTSSAILGKITAPDGSPAANTRIIVVHEPSGTGSEAKTKEKLDEGDGRGLNVCRPYWPVQQRVADNTTTTRALLGILKHHNCSNSGLTQRRLLE